MCHCYLLMKLFCSKKKTKKAVIEKNHFDSVVLNAPFYPVKQSLCNNECKETMVKTPQHKVIKLVLPDYSFFLCFDWTIKVSLYPM